MKVEERTFRFYEIAFCLMASVMLFMLFIVIFFIQLKMNPYDINKDGTVDWNDIIEVQNYVVGEEDEESNA